MQVQLCSSVEDAEWLISGQWCRLASVCLLLAESYLSVSAASYLNWQRERERDEHSSKGHIALNPWIQCVSSQHTQSAHIFRLLCERVFITVVLQNCDLKSVLECYNSNLAHCCQLGWLRGSNLLYVGSSSPCWRQSSINTQHVHTHTQRERCYLHPNHCDSVRNADMWVRLEEAQLFGTVSTAVCICVSVCMWVCVVALFKSIWACFLWCICFCLISLDLSLCLD